MPPLQMLRKSVSTESLYSAASSPESSTRKKPRSLKSRELPPLSLPPRRSRGYSSDHSSPPVLERSRSSSSDSGGGSSPSPIPQANRRRAQSHGSPVSSAASPPPSTPKRTSKEKNDLDMKLQRAILQYGRSDARVGDLWNAMGNTYFRAGDVKGAIRAYKSAALCGEGIHVATAYLNLGTAYWNSMQVKKAIDFLFKALAVFEVSLLNEGKSPLESIEIASCHHQLGLAYSLEESYGKASQSMEKALDIRGRVLGPHNPATARTMDAAGRMHLLRGDVGRAQAYHEQALQILTAAGFSPVTTLEHLATVYQHQKDSTAVVHMYVQIVHWYKAHWMAAPAPRALQESLRKLARAYEQVGEGRYAEDCRSEADLLG
jgi:tetratricopeptide (TPR) repeat protein